MKRMLMLLMAMLLCVPALAETDMLSGWNLPEGTTCVASSVQEGWIGLRIPLKDGELPVTVTCHDGVWQVTELWYSYAMPVCVRDNGYYIHWKGAYYGDLPFDRDVTAIDWSTLPTTEEEAIAGLDVSAWRILKEDTGLCRLSDMLVDEFCAGTPVRLLSDADGSYVRAAILGGEAVYDVPVDALLPGDTQFAGEDGTVAIAYDFTWLEITKDMTLPVLYAAPGGEVAHVLESGATYDLAILTTGEIPGGVVYAQPDMSDVDIPAGASESWLYVADFEAGVDGFLRVDDLPQDLPYMVARRLLPEYRFLQGDVQEDSCCFLVERRLDGAVLFAGCTLVEDKWAVTLSEPLPDSPVLDTFHGSGDYAILSYVDAETGLASIDVFGEEMPWKTCVLTPDGRGGWRVEGIGNDWSSFGVDRCTLRNDYGSQVWWCTPSFDTNLGTLRWDELPDTIEEALALSDIADWVVLTADTPLLDTPGGESLGLYHTGAGLRVLAQSGDWLHVAVADGAVTGYVPADAVIPSAENYAVDEEGWGYSLYILPYVTLRRDEPAVALFDTDGAVLHAFQTRWYKVVRMLGEQGDFYHVYDDSTGLDGFVLKTECEVDDE